MNNVNQFDQQVFKDMKRLIAVHLWQLEAIKVNLNKPFHLVSGNYSPIYINCRQLISSNFFIDLFVAAVRLLIKNFEIQFDVLAGGETAGIPFAAFLARALSKPMIYVRKKTKAHGLSSRIEGNLASYANVLLVEDLITDAGSKLNFIEAIRSAGAKIHDVIVIFDRLQGGREALKNEEIQLHAITDMNLVLSEAETSGFLSNEELKSVQEYLVSPSNWHKKHNLPFKE